ncbi:ABC transporter permease [Eshraghiella crossota]|uniref:ABC transporter permease n=1 Tax=Eshraghiella crossota TaxID=45851 RepID=UPI000E9D1975|nr:ABC transporter permease subunit [Butyrivibrio crossotus]HAI91766.1 ABC transporter permease [Butyrivibrio sp.]HAX07696.1 ABC transporter permease [Butyrivibrio sp.]
MTGKIKRKKSLFKRLHENKKFLAAESIFLPVLLGLVIYLLWQFQILHKILNTNTFVLPLPSRIGHIITGNWSRIVVDIKATMTVALIGLAVGVLAGYLIAVLASVFPLWMKSGVTIVAAFNAIPIVALAPVMTNWTKDVSSDANFRSMVAKTIVVAIVSMANMSINAYRGLTELKPYSEDLMRTVAAGRMKVLFKLRIPNSVPYIFTALKVAVPSSIISAIVSEYFAEYIVGVGRKIRENIVLAQYSTAWAYITVACVLGILMYVVLMIIQKIFLGKRYRAS